MGNILLNPGKRSRLPEEGSLSSVDASGLLDMSSRTLFSETLTLANYPCHFRTSVLMLAIPAFLSLGTLASVLQANPATEAPPTTSRMAMDIPYREGIDTDLDVRERCRLDLYNPENTEGFATVVWTLAHRSLLRLLRALLRERTFSRWLPHQHDWIGQALGGPPTAWMPIKRGIDPLYSSHIVDHLTVLAEQGIAGHQPIIDAMAPLLHPHKDAPPLVAAICSVYWEIIALSAL